MEFYDLLIQNKETLKIVYGLFITLICFFIVLKTHKLFKLSFHQGIRYFRNAFLFYGLAFFTRYIIGSFYFPTQTGFYLNLIFEFFLIMTGFFLLYSLTWKKFETPPNTYKSSLFNPVVIVFYLMAFSIALADFFWRNYYFMFVSQILIFLILSVISFNNYFNDDKKAKFLKFYFIAMVLTLTTWILNALASLIFEWNKGILINIYLVNLIVFTLFLFGVIKVTKK
jgi:hypothetical protein